MFKNKLLIFIILILFFGTVFALFCNVDKSEINGKMENESFIDQAEEKFHFSTIEVNGVFFDIVTVDFKYINLIKFYYQDGDKQNIGNINNLKSLLDDEGEKLAFSMNGGIFSEDFTPLGLYIENGKKVSEINLNKSEGNFYLEPNGIFIIQDALAKIVKSKAYVESASDLFAIQSGPMLLIDNKINSVFNESSENRYIRNGVGITEDGNVVFVISNSPVTFYEFTALFKNNLNCNNALYLDGAISEMYVSGKRENVEREFGTMIGIVE